MSAATIRRCACGSGLDVDDDGICVVCWFEQRPPLTMVLEAPSVETIMARSWRYRDPEPLTPAQVSMNDANRDSDDGPLPSSDVICAACSADVHPDDETCFCCGADVREAAEADGDE